MTEKTKMPVYQPEHLTHRMPRVLFVATKIFPGIGFGASIDPVAESMGCACAKYATQYIDAIVPAHYRLSSRDATSIALKKAADDGKPYDFIITDTIYAAKEILGKTEEDTTPVNVPMEGMPYSPPLLLFSLTRQDQLLADMLVEDVPKFSILSAEVPIKGETSIQQDIAILEAIEADCETKGIIFEDIPNKEMGRLMNEYAQRLSINAGASTSKLDDLIESILGEEGVKRLECQPEECTHATWRDGGSSAQNLDADGQRIHDHPTPRYQR